MEKGSRNRSAKLNKVGPLKEAKEMLDLDSGSVPTFSLKGKVEFQ